MLGLNLLLLRRAFAPLRQLTAFARRIDPLNPGPRVQVGGGASEAAELADAFNEMLDRLEAERRDSVGRALAAQEGERLRVAQELHDGVGQTLTGVVLQLGRAARHVPDEAREGVLEAQETARDSLEEVRRIARDLRPEALDDLGLASALRVLGERVGQQSGLVVDVHVQPGLEFDEQAELVVYRVAQEALTNVARHAGAARAEVRLERPAAGDPRRRPRPRRGRRGRRHPRHARARGADRRRVATRRESIGRHARHPGAAMTNILLADDHAVVRRGLRLVLEGEPDLRVVAEAGDGAEAVKLGMNAEVDLAVLDVSMPRMTGLQAARELTAARKDLRVLILSMHDNEQYLFEALRAGASGYVLKSVADRDLVEACRATMRGEPFLYPGAVRALMKDFVERARRGEVPPDDPLTPRETEIVKLIAEARTTREIAAELVLSEKTVERHRTNILSKLGMRDRVELVRYAIRRGLVEP